MSYPEVSEAVIKKNKELIEKYPFLLPRSRWTDEVDPGFDYSYTELDNMPDGWRNAFGEQMCEEIAEALKRANFFEEYRILQIKEKFGELRWYDAGAPQEVIDIITKYSLLSLKTCIMCGKPATKISRGWISPFCDTCGNRVLTTYVPIEEFYDASVLGISANSEDEPEE